MMPPAAAAFLVALGIGLLSAWASAPPERPLGPYPVGQPGATPVRFVPTPTPLGFVTVPGRELRLTCGSVLEPASLRCLHLGAVRPVHEGPATYTGPR